MEKHGDFREATKEMGDYVLRNWNHPNAGRRSDLRDILTSYVSAREKYNDEVKEHFAIRTSDAATWFNDRINQFQSVAANYVKTPNAHTGWLTGEIAAWLLRPYSDQMGKDATMPFPPNRIGAKRKAPWNVIVPKCVSAVLFALAGALIAACYSFFSPTAGYAVLALCGILFARRYVQMRDFKKERAKVLRLWRKVYHLHDEVERGTYNSREIIRLFRRIEDDDVLLPSIFLSVIALAEPKVG